LAWVGARGRPRILGVRAGARGCIAALGVRAQDGQKGRWAGGKRGAASIRGLSRSGGGCAGAGGGAGAGGAALARAAAKSRGVGRKGKKVQGRLSRGPGLAAAQGGGRTTCGVWLGRTGLEVWANRACGSGRVGQRVRKGWLGWRFSRQRQLCGLGQAGVG